MKLIRKILFPFSVLYGFVIYIRNWCFDVGLFKSYIPTVKTICVGNLSVGGTGKTPMVEYLIQLLGKDNKIAVLSRGYKRKSKGFLLANTHTTVEMLGDEPYQFYKKFKGNIPVAVNANRKQGIQYLINKISGLKIIILDDAYQHRKVNAHINILLTAYKDLYVDDWYLPTGNLRDHKNQVKRAQAVVVTKCPEQLSEEEKRHIENKLLLPSHTALFFTKIHYGDIINNDGEILSIKDLKQHKITLVTGIANPKPLVTYLQRQGIEFTHKSFNDHHFFTEKELQELANKKIVLTTEKDYVRLQFKLTNVWYIPIDTIFLNKKDEFEMLVKK